MKKILKQRICTVLCLVLLCVTCIPGMASADNSTTITELTIYGVESPAAGNTILNQVRVSQHAKVAESWFYTDSERNARFKKGEKFKEDEIYTLAVYLRADEGYSFGKIANPQEDIKLPGVPKYTYTVSTWKYEDDLIVYVKFKKMDYEIIQDLSAYRVRPAVVGEECSVQYETAVPEIYRYYTVEEGDWCDEDGQPYPYYYEFNEGNEYQLSLKCLPISGAVFATDLNLDTVLRSTLVGIPETDYTTSFYKSGNYVYVTYTFDEPYNQWDREITRIDGLNITAPEDGQRVGQMKVTADSSVGYTVDNVKWHEYYNASEPGYETEYIKTAISSSSIMRADKTYAVSFDMKPKSGYEFKVGRYRFPEMEKLFAFPYDYDIDRNAAEGSYSVTIYFYHTRQDLPFTDVNSSDWFYDYVQLSYKYGIMTGKNEKSFEPFTPLVRAEFVTTLYRIAGSPSVTITNQFPDVPADAWFAKTVSWAAKEKVVGGYSNGNFGPADKITREQMAVMLYRYAKSMGYSMDETTDISKFVDKDYVSDFAKTELQWAVAAGIITGKDNMTKLDPQGEATRAECATILMRFLNHYTML